MAAVRVAAVISETRSLRLRNRWKTICGQFGSPRRARGSPVVVPAGLQWRKPRKPTLPRGTSNLDVDEPFGFVNPIPQCPPFVFLATYLQKVSAHLWPDPGRHGGRQHLDVVTFPDPFSMTLPKTRARHYQWECQSNPTGMCPVTPTPTSPLDLRVATRGDAADHPRALLKCRVAIRQTENIG